MAKLFEDPGCERGGSWARSILEQMSDALKEMVADHSQPLSELRGLIVVTWAKANAMVFVPSAAKELRDHLERMPETIVPEQFKKDAVEQFDKLTEAKPDGMLPVLVIGFDDEGMCCGRFRMQIGEGYIS